MAVAMVPETNAFTAGGGGNVPSGKREYMKVRHKWDIILYSVRFPAF